LQKAAGEIYARQTDEGAKEGIKKAIQKITKMSNPQSKGEEI
jgi:hypothetical protein